MILNYLITTAFNDICLGMTNTEFCDFCKKICCLHFIQIKLAKFAFFISKGSLISDDILTSVPFPSQGTKPLMRTLEYPTQNSNQIKFSAQGSHLAPFLNDNEAKITITSEIKQPLILLLFARLMSLLCFRLLRILLITFHSN